QAGNVVLVWLVGQAIGADVPASYYWIMVPMVSLLTMLPVSINGIGMRENATVVFLAPLAVPEHVALMLAMLWFSVFLAVSVLGGLVYLLGDFPKPAAVPQADETEADDGPVVGGADQGRARQHWPAA